MTPRVQVALDVTTAARALEVLEQCAFGIDIIEAGTVLCLSEGLGAVATLRSAYPDHPLVADIRIARAGKKFADMAFGAGATIVTVVGESPLDVVEGAAQSASANGGQVEVELGSQWTPDDVARWVDLDVANLIVHRPVGVSGRDDHHTRETLERLRRCELGSTQVTLAGGLTAAGMRYFSDFQIDVVVVGSAIVEADSPRLALQAFIDALREIPSA